VERFGGLSPFNLAALTDENLRAFHHFQIASGFKLPAIVRCCILLSERKNFWPNVRILLQK